MQSLASVRRTLLLLYRPASILALVLLVLAPLHAGKIPCKFVTNGRIVAVADIHGDFDNFEKILRGTGLIDDNNDWAGGTTHFVQLGDILDRGDGSKDALDLLMKLEKQAEAAGGMVHVLIGNHEEANITGIVFDQARYLTVGQLISFLPPAYVKKMEREIRKKYSTKPGSNGKKEAEIESLWQKEINSATPKQPGQHKTRDLYTKHFYEIYGKWLLTKNVVIKINDCLFVHGGMPVDDYFVGKDLETINNEARRELRVIAEWAAGERKELMLPFSTPKYVMSPAAPQWIRDWARDPEDGNSATLDQIFAFYKARHMVIGHTVRDVRFIETRELSRFRGRVWAIDVGISNYYNDVLCALTIERERIQVIMREYAFSTFQVWWGDDEKN